jgi:hypothetical protein
MLTSLIDKVPDFKGFIARCIAEGEGIRRPYKSTTV